MVESAEGRRAATVTPGPDAAQAADLTNLAGGMKSLYRSIRQNILEAAELMPEDKYAFKPSADVRTFGQLVGHVTNTHYNFCSAAREVPSPNKRNNETLTTKAELVAALKESLAFCDAAYELSDTDLIKPAKFGTAAITRGYALTYNIAHDNEHYGNIVTYLRLNGLVPPSTARRGGGRP